jgi:hypothetical protein
MESRMEVLDGKSDRRSDGWTDGGMDREMDRWTGGRLDRSTDEAAGAGVPLTLC